MMNDPRVASQILNGKGGGQPSPTLPTGGSDGDGDADDEKPEPQVGPQSKAEDAPQLELSEPELNRLAARIDEDFNAAINDHQRRMVINRRRYYLWRSRVGEAGGELLKSNFRVPFTEWQLLGMLAKQQDALFGDDAQIVGVPTIPTQADLSGKVGDYMTWRVFDSMKAKLKMIEFNFIKLLFGRAHAYVPYIRDTFLDGSDGKEVVEYEGPGFYPLMPDDFIAPAERVRTLHDFSWVIRRCYPTPDELLEGEDCGKYFGINANFKNILVQSQNKRPRDYRTDLVRELKEIMEGVQYYFAWSWGEVIDVHEWYGNWRMLLDPAHDAELNDIDNRQRHRTELKVSYIPELHQVVGVQLLADLYPRMRYRRPFVESACLATGEYWGKGVPEMTEDVGLEMTATENIMTEYAERAMSPMLGVRPRASAKMRRARVEPGGIIELDDPTKDVSVLQLVAPGATQNYSSRQQALQSYGERVTGLTDQSMGRSPTGANSDPTARGKMLDAQNESVRLGLDYTVLREDWKIILERIWMLDCLYGPPEMFFRVTGKSPQGLYDVDHGFGTMTAQDRAGRYDFDIRFATSEYSKEAKKQALTSIGTLALQTPVVAQNPQAQWHILADQYELVDVDFAQYVPKPPMPASPKDPEDEWHMMLQAQPVHVHPLDQDNHHLAVHEVQLHDAVTDKTGQHDESAIKRLLIHIAEHNQQTHKKILAAQMTQAVTALTNMLGLHPGQVAGSHIGPQGQLGGAPGAGGNPLQALLGQGGPGTAPNGNGGGPPGQPSPPAPQGQPSPPNLAAPNMGAMTK